LKIAALDVMFYDIPIEKRLKRIRDLGFEGTELWLGSAEIGFLVEREWPDSYKFKPVSISPEKLRKMAEDAGIQINSFGQHTIMGPIVGPFLCVSPRHLVLQLVHCCWPLLSIVHEHALVCPHHSWR